MKEEDHDYVNEVIEKALDYQEDEVKALYRAYSNREDSGHREWFSRLCHQIQEHFWNENPYDFCIENIHETSVVFGSINRVRWDIDGEIKVFKHLCNTAFYERAISKPFQFIP